LSAGLLLLTLAVREGALRDWGEDFWRKSPVPFPTALQLNPIHLRFDSKGMENHNLSGRTGQLHS
jgi:hypothetical protein